MHQGQNQSLTTLICSWEIGQLHSKGDRTAWVIRPLIIGHRGVDISYQVEEQIKL